jgi:hypothetical protein
MKQGYLIPLLFVALLLCDGAQASAQRSSGRGSGAPPKGSFRIGANGGIAILGDDLTKTFDNYRLGPIADLDFAYLAHQNFSVGLYGGLGAMASRFGEDEAKNFFQWYGVQFEGRVITNRGAIIPFAFVRLGGISTSPAITRYGITTETGSVSAFTYGIGAGIEFLVKKGRNPISVRFTAGGNLTTTDELDRFVSGGNKDGFSFISAGMMFYFSKR